MPLVTCRGIAMSGSNANAAEHYSAWWRFAFGAAVTLRLEQQSPEHFFE
jgi:hypothetical protein